jgi:aerobic-type carbon monoxide dehydrogenase small subunit (CoxS/CutS family)
VREAGSCQIQVTINGQEQGARVEPRLLLSDFIRRHAGLTGTHAGCEHGVCGACTVLIDGEPQRSCLVFAVQADGAAVETVEGLAGDELNPLQQAFHDAHAMQCGFCTPGLLMSVTALLRENPAAGEDEILDTLSGNLCRCTGYANIVEAVHLAQQRMTGGG